MSNPKLVSIITHVNESIEKGVLAHRAKGRKRKGEPIEIIVDLGIEPTYRGEAIAKILETYAKECLGRSLYATHDILFDLSAQTHWRKIEPGMPCTAQFIKIVVDKVPIK